jgi:radical SAM protein with 4Fe4S-binding SPASM domain
MKETFKAWLKKHQEDYFGNDAVGLGCFNHEPFDVAWAVTKLCNLSCAHCSINASPNANREGELNTEEGLALIEDVAKLGPVKFVITGGEALLREDIFELIKHATSSGMVVELASNGILIDESVAKRLKDLGVYRAAISMDGIGETHDRLRGAKGTFEKTMRAVKACKKVGLKVQFHVTMTKANLKQLPGIIKLADRYQVDRIYIGNLISIGRGRQISQACLSGEEMKQIFNTVIDQQTKTNVWLRPVCPQFWAFLESEGLIDGDDRHEFIGCTAGISSFHIRPNGDVTLCAELPANIGNVREKPFTTIIKEAKILQKLKDRKNEITGNCADCQYLSVCGGCRARAYTVSGDVFAEDPVCFLDKASCSVQRQTVMASNPVSNTKG